MFKEILKKSDDIDLHIDIENLIPILVDSMFQEIQRQPLGTSHLDLCNKSCIELFKFLVLKWNKTSSVSCSIPLKQVSKKLGLTYGDVEKYLKTLARYSLIVCYHTNPSDFIVAPLKCEITKLGETLVFYGDRPSSVYFTEALHHILKTGVERKNSLKELQGELIDVTYGFKPPKIHPEIMKLGGLLS